MKILSWNIRGGGSAGKRRAIKEVICRENPDLVVLQEVKKINIDRNFVGSIWCSRFKDWLLLPYVGRSGGIVIMWDARNVKVIGSLIGDFSVSVHIENFDGKQWWFTGVYGPNKSNRRTQFWDELAGLFTVCGDAWCLGGDFNSIRYTFEKHNSFRTTRSMRTFNELIGELSLIEPPLLNAQFTWSNFREVPVCCRLDRFLYSAGWEVLFGAPRHEATVRAVSDHRPITLDTSPPIWGPSPFRFENMRLDHKNFFDLVTN